MRRCSDCGVNLTAHNACAYCGTACTECCKETAVQARLKQTKPKPESVSQELKDIREASWALSETSISLVHESKLDKPDMDRIISLIDRIRNHSQSIVFNAATLRNES